MKQIVKIVDLFAGLGGLRLGVEQAFNEKGIDIKCVATSEIKEHAIQALNYNFTQENMVGDITKIDVENLEDFDILLAGFPCQPFSSAGNRLGFLDTRGTMFFEVEKILRAKKPYAFILENVEGLIRHDLENKNDKIGRTLKTILCVLKDIGYKVEWKLLDSKDFGVAQSRKRVFIVGTLDKKINMENFEVKNSVFEDVMEHGLPTIESHFTKCLLSHYSKEELYGKAIKDKRGGENNIHSWDICLKGEISVEQREVLELLFKERRKKKWAKEIGIKWMDGMPLTLEQIKTFYYSENLKELLDDLVEKGYLRMEHPKSLVEEELENGGVRKVRKQDVRKPMGYNIVTGKLSFEFTKILNPKDITPTLVAMDVDKIGVVDGKGIRKLTLREGLRLCGYPETYSLEFLESDEKSKKLGFDLLGNTVVIPVVKEIANRLVTTCYLYKNIL